MEKSSLLSSKPCIWVTRPEPHASAHAEVLEARGFSTTISPVLDIEPLPLPATVPSHLANSDALLVSSQNALTHLPEKWITQFRTLPLFVSGQATHDLALELGFSTVSASTGNGSRGMLELIETALRDAKNAPRSKLLYLAGTPRTPFLEDSMPNNISLVIAEVYHSNLASHIATETLAAIDSEEVVATTLFSSRSALHTANLLQNLPDMQAEKSLQTILAVCISQTVEKVAREQGFLKTSISDAESSESMVDKLVDQLKIHYI